MGIFYPAMVSFDYFLEAHQTRSISLQTWKGMGTSQPSQTLSQANFAVWGKVLGMAFETWDSDLPQLLLE